MFYTYSKELVNYLLYDQFDNQERVQHIRHQNLERIESENHLIQQDGPSFSRGPKLQHLICVFGVFLQNRTHLMHQHI